jgi:WhiB family redox-sensing transcriptional regulator
VDPELFYPVSADPYSPQALQAKRVCQRCPIIAECLMKALESQDQHGILGGTSPEERRQMKRRRAAA